MRTVCSYEDDRLSGLSHGDDNNNTNYTFTYDGFGRCTRVKAGTRNLVTQTWAANVTTAYAYDNGGNMTIRKTNERNTNVF